MAVRSINNKNYVLIPAKDVCSDGVKVHKTVILDSKSIYMDGLNGQNLREYLHNIFAPNRVKLISGEDYSWQLGGFSD